MCKVLYKEKARELEQQKFGKIYKSVNHDYISMLELSFLIFLYLYFPNLGAINFYFIYNV